MNPSAWINCRSEDGHQLKFRYIYYNNKLHAPAGARNEYRITHMTGYLRDVGAKEGDTFRDSVHPAGMCTKYLIKPKQKPETSDTEGPVRIKLWVEEGSLVSAPCSSSRALFSRSRHRMCSQPCVLFPAARGRPNTAFQKVSSLKGRCRLSRYLPPQADLPILQAPCGQPGPEFSAQLDNPCLGFNSVGEGCVLRPSRVTVSASHVWFYCNI